MHEETMLDPPPPARLAPATGGLGGPLRDALERLRRLGVRAVQLDARDPALRPAGLSSSGRRDLLATLRRRELALSGLDCLLPPRDLTGPATSDRAVEHVLAVIRLAADLGRVPVSMRLPRAAGAGAAGAAAAAAPGAASPPRSPAPRPGGGGLVVAATGDPDVLAAAAAMEAGSGAAAGLAAAPALVSGDPADASDPAVVVAALAAAADRHGVPLIDHAVPPAGAGPVRPGVDAAACLAAGVDPVSALLAAGDRLGAVRLADLTDDGRRVPLGHAEGRLELPGLAAAIAGGGLDVPLVLDVRQCGEPWAALRAGAERWAELAP